MKRIELEFLLAQRSRPKNRIPPASGGTLRTKGAEEIAVWYNMGN